MAQVSRATHTTLLNENINDNTVGDITAAEVREVIASLRDSVVWFDEKTVIPDDLVRSDPVDVPGGEAITNIVRTTQAVYDILTPDPSTIYIIMG